MNLEANDINILDDIGIVTFFVNNILDKLKSNQSKEYYITEKLNDLHRYFKNDHQQVELLGDYTEILEKVFSNLFYDKPLTNDSMKKKINILESFKNLEALRKLDENSRRERLKKIASFILNIKKNNFNNILDDIDQKMIEKLENLAY